MFMPAIPHVQTTAMNNTQQLLAADVLELLLSGRVGSRNALIISR